MTFSRPTKPILMLVALTLSAMLLEGAGIDWSVIFMRDVFATPPFISGLALALVAFSQFIVRFFADDFVERYGPEKVSYWSVITLGIGVSLVSFAPDPLVALAGFSLLGAGTAVIFPLAISAAARQKGPACGGQCCRAGTAVFRGVSAGTTIAWGGCRVFRHPCLFRHRAAVGRAELVHGAVITPKHVIPGWAIPRTGRGQQKSGHRKRWPPRKICAASLRSSSGSGRRSLGQTFCLGVDHDLP